MTSQFLYYLYYVRKQTEWNEMKRILYEAMISINKLKLYYI